MVLLIDRARIRPSTTRQTDRVRRSFISWMPPLVAGALLAAGCSGSADEASGGDPGRVVLNPPEDGASHTHAPGEADSATIGDGTSAATGGYRLAEVRLPRRTGQPGPASFEVLGPDGRPIRDYEVQQTKEMHAYVVRTDLAVYRHVHPQLDDSGRWTMPVDLDQPGTYRVIVDFLPRGEEQPVVLGASATVPGRWTQQPLAEGGDDGVVAVDVDGSGSVGPDGRLHLLVRTVEGDPVQLGTYLGATAHVSGFLTEARDQVFVHVHPYGAPEQTDDGTRLTFHTTFDRPGDYRLFVQVRVDGIVHTVPVDATVAR